MPTRTAVAVVHGRRWASGLDFDETVEDAAETNKVLRDPDSGHYLHASTGDGSDTAFERYGANNARFLIEKIEAHFRVRMVTQENLLAWVRSRCNTNNDEQVQSELAGILGRWTWWTTDWSSKSDLQEALHECRLNGCRGYSQMTIEELLVEIFNESALIEYQRDRYDEMSKPRPFDMDTLIESDKALWLDE